MTPSARKRSLLSLAASFLCFLAITVSGQEEAAKLVLSSRAVTTGQEIEIELRLEDSDSRVAALAFVIDYDASKLALAAAQPASSVTFELPSGFTAHAFPFPEEGRLGVAIYDPDAPVSVLADCVLARVRFRVLPEAGGTASFGIEPSASAADRDAELVPLTAPAEPLGVTLPGTTAAPRRRRPAATVPGGSPNEETDPASSKWVFPAVANGSSPRSRTQLVLTNPSEQEIAVAIQIEPAKPASLRSEVKLAPGETRIIEDLMAVLAPDPLSAGDAAAVVVESNAPSLKLSANLRSPGTGLALTLPVAGWEDLLDGTGVRTLVVRELREGGSPRIAMVNVGDDSALVRIAVRDARGAVIQREVLAVNGGMSTTLDLREIMQGDHDVLLIELTSSGSKVLSYLIQQDRLTLRPSVRIAQ